MNIFFVQADANHSTEIFPWCPAALAFKLNILPSMNVYRYMHVYVPYNINKNINLVSVFQGDIIACFLHRNALKLLRFNSSYACLFSMVARWWGKH